MGPLAGIRIIDLTTVLMGPYATQCLADYGAEVIKVEPLRGDLVREIGPQPGAGMGPLFLNANRAKRSVALNLKDPDARTILLDLLRDADVLVYNIRPAAMARLGLSHDDVTAVNPRLIYAGCYGYGQDGAYAANPAYDDLIQGGCGLAHLFSRVDGGAPRYVPSAIADRIVGLMAVGAILAALVARGDGPGQRVDIPMFETMVSFVMGDHMGGLTYDPPLDGGGYVRQLARDRRPYRTADGHVCALLYTDDHWRRFLGAIGRGALMDTDPRFASFSARMAHLDVVYGTLAEIFLTRTSAEWVRLLTEVDVPVMWLHDFQSILNDPHLTSVGFFRRMTHPSEGPVVSMANPVRMSRTPIDDTGHAPRLGQHTLETLRALGLSDATIDELVARKAVGIAPAEG
ncbi:MAG: CaiB/BaiF CoA transferase family protein [Alkalilacustris sp.]